MSSGGGPPPKAASYRRARALYEARGDVPASLAQYDALSQDERAEGEEAGAGGAAGYNSSVLRALGGGGGGGDLPPPPPPADGDGDAAALAARNSAAGLTALHNAALGAYAASDPGAALGLLAPALRGWILPGGGAAAAGGEEEEEEAQQQLPLAARIDLAFLAADCVLGRHRGDALGLSPVLLGEEDGGGGDGRSGEEQQLTVDRVLQFAEKCTAQLAQSGGDSAAADADELTFRASVYRSRVLLAKQSARNGGVDSDRMTRMARKDLKGAMETYNHKLVPKATQGGAAGAGAGGTGTGTGTGTGGGGSVGSGGDAPGGPLDRPDPGLPPGAAGADPRVQRTLDAQNQYALSLKAHLECLKDNGKKAVKLAAEARHAGERRRARPGSGGDDAIGGGAQNDDADAVAIDDAQHLNNLALLHQTEGKNHAALHYYSRALSSLEGISHTAATSNTGGSDGSASIPFESDGTALPNPLPSILHNAALCAFAVRNYVTSYECMARAVRLDPAAYGSRARCHLRMAEACLGVHEDCKADRRAEGQRLFEEMGRLPLGGGVAASTVVRDLAFRGATPAADGSGSDSADPAANAASEPPALEIVDVDDASAANAAFALHDAERRGAGQRPDPRLAAAALYRPLPPTADGTAALESELGSAADLQQTSAQPVPRAFFCLERAVEICLEQAEHDGVADRDCMESTLLLLAYLHLEVGQPDQALACCRSVLDGTLRFSEEHSRATEAPSAASKRRVATAKLYECEALCLLQQAEEGLRALAEDKTATNKDVLSSLEELDSLTKDLAYLLPIPENEEGKSGDEAADDRVAAQFRLDAAKSIVHAVAAAAAASSDQPSLGRAHAMCALKTTLSQDTGARKTLLYCLLKEGKVHQVLELLQGAGRRVGVQT